MATKLRGRRGGVLDGWDLRRRHTAARGQPARQELRGRRPGEGAEVAVEVRLVVVAAVEREVAEAAAGVERRDRALEAQDARERLRGQPDLGAEARGEVAAAPAHLLGEAADR